jgi:hypothetical protein
MGVEELNKRWEAVAERHISSEMSFDGDLLVLGARTRLAKVGVELDELRLTALLAAAHGRSVAWPSLRHIQRALEKKRDGDLVLALIHLALSGTAKLEDPKEDARRLFLADALLSDGVEPKVILKGLGLDPRPLDQGLDKYNPDQPRVPAGNPDGGQWTSEDWAGASNPQPQRPKGVEVADASATRGREVRSDAASTVTDEQTTSAPSGSSRANDQSFQVTQNLDESCQAFIAANCRASILRVFPGQYLGCTLREVLDAAKAGDRAAQTACKLLFRKEYRK